MGESVIVQLLDALQGGGGSSLHDALQTAGGATSGLADATGARLAGIADAAPSQPGLLQRIDDHRALAGQSRSGDTDSARAVV